ncbi:hypothetical protein VNO77_18732 [Canavalia gladiata]|uniref:Uncharacterized protein n=1 Tax=Canavalia gladiata TaxID=3824 RepID=A0AAN9QJW9_CANGL
MRGTPARGLRWTWSQADAAKALEPKVNLAELGSKKGKQIMAPVTGNWAAKLEVGYTSCYNNGWVLSYMGTSQGLGQTISFLHLSACLFGAGSEACITADSIKRLHKSRLTRVFHRKFLCDLMPKLKPNLASYDSRCKVESKHDRMVASGRSKNEESRRNPPPELRPNPKIKELQSTPPRTPSFTSLLFLFCLISFLFSFLVLALLSRTPPWNPECEP